MERAVEFIEQLHLAEVFDSDVELVTLEHRPPFTLDDTDGLGE